MNAQSIPGYPYPHELHEHLPTLISTVLRMQDKSVHPDNHGAGATILFLDDSGAVFYFVGASKRVRPEDGDEVRDCAEPTALHKLQEHLAGGAKGRVLALAVSAAVRGNKDLLSWILGARPPCNSCQELLHECAEIDDDTPVVLVRPGKTLIIHTFGHIWQIYQHFGYAGADLP